MQYLTLIRQNNRKTVYLYFTTKNMNCIDKNKVFRRNGKPYRILFIYKIVKLFYRLFFKFVDFIYFAVYIT